MDPVYMVGVLLQVFQLIFPVPTYVRLVHDIISIMMKTLKDPGPFLDVLVKNPMDVVDVVNPYWHL